VRGSAAILVVGLHVALIYVLAVSLGIAPPPPVEKVSRIFFVDNPDPPPPPDVPVVDGPPRQQAPLSPVPVPDIPLDLPPLPNAIDEVTPVFPDAPPVDAGGSGPVIETGISIVRKFDPPYPPAEIRAEHEGVVRLKILVDERGRASDVQVAKSSGYPRLDDSAVRTVRRWQFTPATRDARPVAKWTELNVVFRLDR
jgi:protein TonB